MTERLKSALAVPAVVFAVFLVAPQAAYAYLDAGTGSYMLQVFLAVVLGAGVFVRVYWTKLRAFVKGVLYRKGHGNT